MALFSGDSMWYRARIIGLPGNRQVDVHYVDFGNTERVSIFNCRKILDTFLVLPSQALCCSLTDVEPLNAEDGWSENVSIVKVLKFRTQEKIAVIILKFEQCRFTSE